MSMPFRDRPLTLTQPDGSTIEARGSGNQHVARFETLDGRPIVRDPETGWYRPAQPDGGAETASGNAFSAMESSAGVATAEAETMAGLPRIVSRWQERRDERRQDQRAGADAMESSALEASGPPPRKPIIGAYVGLTLLVDFADEPATIPREEVEAFCNRRGYRGYGNNGSVRDYFFDNSGGLLDYTNIVLPYYRARHPRSYYTDPSQAYPKRAQELIREALAKLVADRFDPRRLTADGSNFVRALNVFYAGRRENEWSTGLWPHQSRLGPAVRLGRRRRAADYQITDMGDELTLGTFCHENGHMVCNFPDLYDYDEEAESSNGAGKFCLMCFGGLAPRERNPAQISAYLKHAAGWSSDPTRLTPGQRVSLAAGRNQFAIHRRSATEYYLIENRAASGRDAGLDANGLAVWHVDELGNNSHQDGTAARHYECALVQADGLRELEERIDDGDDHDLFKAGHNSALSDSGNPHCRWWDGTASRLSIKEISAAGPTMTFKVV